MEKLKLNKDKDTFSQMVFETLFRAYFRLIFQNLMAQNTQENFRDLDCQGHFDSGGNQGWRN